MEALRFSSIVAIGLAPFVPIQKLFLHGEIRLGYLCATKPFMSSVL